MAQRILQENLDEGIRFDKQGRMLYHPDFHPNNGKHWKEEELEYLCKFCHFDSMRSLSFALGRPETGVATQLSKIKKEGKFGHYKRLNKHWL